MVSQSGVEDFSGGFLGLRAARLSGLKGLPLNPKPRAPRMQGAVAGGQNPALAVRRCM